MIKDSKVYNEFIDCSVKVENHKKIKELTNKIKKLQKQRVNANHIDKHEMVQKLTQEIDDLHEQLDSIPLYSAFEMYKSEVESMLKMITSSIEYSINKNNVLD